MTMKAAPEAVFAVLADPWTYPDWLVGCKEIRAVDDGWPAPGTRFHHRVGIVGPLTLEDHTKVLECEPGRRLLLEARARPAGVASVEFVLGDDDAGGTVLTLHEAPVRGVAARLHNPLLDALVKARNEKSLKGLSEAVTTAPSRGAAG